MPSNARREPAASRRLAGGRRVARRDRIPIPAADARPRAGRQVPGRFDRRSAMTSAGSVGGFTCQRCGYWVPNGTVHTCGNTAPVSTGITPALRTDERQAAALERIALALERLAAADTPISRK